MTDTTDHRLTIRQAADLLHVSVDTMRRWDKEGRLTSSGRTMGGWRYYLFTDIQTIVKDLAYRHQKSALQRTAQQLTQETLQAFKAAYQLPLRTKSSLETELVEESPAYPEYPLPENENHAKSSLMEKAQNLLDAVKNEDYETAIHVLTGISDDLSQTQK